MRIATVLVVLLCLEASAIAAEAGQVRFTKRPKPWSYTCFNAHLLHYGGVMKFSPKGGKFYIWRTRGRNKQPRPADMPAGLPTFRSGYLGQNIAVEGMEWYVRGCSPVPTSGEGWGDPSCTCWNVRIKADPYGRTYAPDALRFCVNVFDTAGNLITRVGRYGNADDRGPDVHLAWPAYVDVVGDELYVVDSNANRVAVVRMRYAAEGASGL